MGKTVLLSVKGVRAKISEACGADGVFAAAGYCVHLVGVSRQGGGAHASALPSLLPSPSSASLCAAVT